MFQASGLVPARFLTLISHLVLTAAAFLGREENVLACLPFDYTEEQMNRKDVELATGLAVSLGLLLLELLGFLSGASMFSPAAALLSTSAHASASVALAYFCLDEWDCGLFWWIFAFCSALPAAAEVLLLISMLAMKNTW